MTISISKSTKGYLFALVATIAFSNVYIFSKAALNEVSLAQFWVYWFAIGFVLNSIYCLSTGAFSEFARIGKGKYKQLLILGLLEIIVTSSFFMAINMISDPSVASFIGNMYMVFLILFGVILLKEKFSKWEVVGVIVTLLGAFSVGYKGGHSLTDFFVPGTWIVLFNTLIAAFTSIVVKQSMKTHSPAIINFNRTLFLLIAALIFIKIQGDSFQISQAAIVNISIGAILGPFVAMLTIYYSFKYIDASKSSIIQGLKGVFVLIGTFIYFGTFPLKYQLIGGIASVIGVLIMTLSKARMAKPLK